MLKRDNQQDDEEERGRGLSTPITTMARPPLRLLSHNAFFSAVCSGDLPAVRRVVEELDGPDAVASLVSLQNELGETPLYMAVANSAAEVVEYLAQLCTLEVASLKSSIGVTALHVAAKKGHLGIVNELLKHWPDLCGIGDPKNTTPLYMAAVLNHLDIVSALLDADVSTIKIVRKNGKTSLHTAVRNDLLDMVKLLIERDPDIVSIKDKKGQTALHMAVKGKSTGVVEEILSADVSILNARDKMGNTALHVATRKWRTEIVRLLLSYEAIEVNVLNGSKETTMDLADKITYGPELLDITEALREAGAKHANDIGRSDEANELRRTVSDIKHDVYNQLNENAKTNKRVSVIQKELQKLHREAVQNTNNSITVVAVLIASIAFMSIFNLPGQYLDIGKEAGQANIADHMGFRVFCLLNATALFISLAVVVVQITLVAWETNAQKQVVSVVNKLLWAACLNICGAFLALAFVVVGKVDSWMAITIAAVGGPILVGTLVILCYFVLRQRFGGFADDSARRIRRASGSKSFSLTLQSFSDPDAYNSEYEKMNKLIAL